MVWQSMYAGWLLLNGGPPSWNHLRKDQFSAPQSVEDKSKQPEWSLAINMSFTREKTEQYHA